MTADVHKYMEMLTAILRRDDRILAAYLLGSIVHGNFREDSDIDCALLLQKGGTLSSVERLRLAGELGATLERTVDLGIISTENLIYAMQAVSGGQLLFARDKTATDERIMYIYSLYATLREDRSEVEKAYESR